MSGGLTPDRTAKTNSLLFPLAGGIWKRRDLPCRKRNLLSCSYLRLPKPIALQFFRFPTINLDNAGKACQFNPMKNLNHAKLVERCEMAIAKSFPDTRKPVQVFPPVALQGTPIIYTGETSREIADYYARKEFNGD